MKYIILCAAAINAAAFLLCGIDKRRAVKKDRRVPERTLFLLSALGGSFGMLIGMILFRHKTKHPGFVIGIPAIILMQAVILYAVYRLRAG